MTNRIMLVEDETIIAMDIQHQLESLGYQVVGHAITGEQAVRLAAELIPELILMNVNLRGEFDGIETAMRIRSFSDVPIIYLTAFADDETYNKSPAYRGFWLPALSQSRTSNFALQSKWLCISTGMRTQIT